MMSNLDSQPGIGADNMIHQVLSASPKIIKRKIRSKNKGNKRKKIKQKKKIQIHWKCSHSIKERDTVKNLDSRI